MIRPKLSGEGFWNEVRCLPGWCFYLDWSRPADKLELLARRIEGSLRGCHIVADQSARDSLEDGDYAKP